MTTSITHIPVSTEEVAIASTEYEKFLQELSEKAHRFQLLMTARTYENYEGLAKLYAPYAYVLKQANVGRFSQQVEFDLTGN